MRMLKTFFRELITQSKTAFSLGTLLMVLRGLSTLSTLRLFITARFSAPELPLQGGFSTGQDSPSQSETEGRRLLLLISGLVEMMLMLLNETDKRTAISLKQTNMGPTCDGVW